MKKALIFLMLAGFSPIVAQGLFEDAVSSEDKNAGQKKPFELNGYVRGVYYGGKIPDEMKAETKSAYGDAALKISVSRSDMSKAFTEMRLSAGYEGDSGFTSFDIREAYVGVYPGPFNFYFGKQIIAWGRADAYNPTNVITPQRFISRSPFEDDRRMGNFLVRSQLNVHPLRFDVIWIPMYAANEMPINADMIAGLIAENMSLVNMPFPVIIEDIEEAYPSASLRNSGVAAKIDLELPAVDGSICYFNGYNPAPGIDLSSALTPEGAVALTPSFKAYRMHLIGADFSTTLGSVMGLRGECAYRTFFKDPEKYVYIPNPDLQYVFGIDKTIKDFSFILQYAGIYVFDFEKLDEPISPVYIPDYEAESKNRLINRQSDRTSHSIVGRPAWSLLHETLSLELVGMYTITTQELMLRPKITYQISDALTASIGGELYVGAEETLFDLLEEEISAGFVEVKASF